MPANSPLLAWFFTAVLLALAARATARLVLARAPGGLTRPVRDAEISHAVMGFGMAALIAPGLPRPPTAVSLCLFAALTAFAVFTWARGTAARARGRAANCGCAPKESAHLLDPHHAIVGAAMIVMLLQPGMGSQGMDAQAMPGMAAQAGGSPGVAVLVFLGYVWISALVLGYGMTRMLPSGGGPALTLSAGGGPAALLGSPATVYGCELAMTVLTGLMLLS